MIEGANHRYQLAGGGHNPPVGVPHSTMVHLPTTSWAFPAEFAPCRICEPPAGGRATELRRGHQE